MTTDHISGDSDIRTELPVTFIALNDEPIPVILTNITFQSDEEAPSCIITFNVEANVVQQLLDKECFHLFPAMIQGQALFEPKLPVSIRAALRSNIAKHIADVEGDAETVLAALLPAATPDNNRISLNQTENWLALDVKQQLELPPALQNSGKLLHGIQTKWKEALRNNDNNEKKLADGTNDQDLSKSIESFLQAKAFNYEKYDENIIRLRFNSSRGSWMSLIRMEHENGIYVFYSVFPEAIPANHRPAIALQLMSENYDLLQGSFEMDHEDGDLRFRSILVNNDTLSHAHFDQHLTEHLQVMEYYLPVVQQMLQQ